MEHPANASTISILSDLRMVFRKLKWILLVFTAGIVAGAFIPKFQYPDMPKPVARYLAHRLLQELSDLPCFKPDDVEEVGSGYERGAHLWMFIFQVRSGVAEGARLTVEVERLGNAKFSMHDKYPTCATLTGSTAAD
jgi:hypothetical protein